MNNLAMRNAMAYLDGDDLGQWAAADVLAFLRWAERYRYPQLPMAITPATTYRRWLQSIAIGEAAALEEEAEAVRLHKALVSRRRRQWDRRRARLSPIVFDRDGRICQICGHHSDDLYIDHIFPIALGGTDDLNNLQVACGPCNNRKGARV